MGPKGESRLRVAGRVGWVVALVVVLVYCSDGFAAPAASALSKYKPTRADALARFDAGNRFYRAASDERRALTDRNRDYERAIAEYTAGSQLEDAPAFDYNIGLSLRTLGRSAEAIAHLERFVDRADPEGDVRTSIAEKITAMDPTGELRAELRRKRLATVAPASEPPPVTVAPTARPVHPPVTADEPTTHEGSSPSSARRWDPLGWGLIATGALGGGVATWLFIDASSLDRSANDAGAHGDQAGRRSLQDRASSRRSLGVAVGVGGGVLVLAGVLKLTVLSGGDPPPTRAAWNLGLTGDGVAVFGRF
jgi:tetratricopeptide (TPR) repeat protein